MKLDKGGSTVKRIHFDTERDSFYGAYWENKNRSDCAMIAMIGDDPEDYMARSGIKWLLKRGINVMSMSPAKKDYGHHNYPLERVENAIKWLKEHGNRRIGIVGVSTTGTLALTAASYFDDITLTIALTPSDFIWQGFMQGKKDGCREWPIEGESLFSYRGEPLPYMPFKYQHPEYWNVVMEDSKKSGNIISSFRLFEESEQVRPHPEDEMINVERIKGRLLLLGAEDDVLWNAAKYIRRMEKRLSERPHECSVEAKVYEHGTHFLFPETMIRAMLPVGSGLFVKIAFKAARKYPKECRQTRIDVDRRTHDAIEKWRTEDIAK